MDGHKLLRPAFWGGVLIAVLTGIPMLNWVNCMCCAGVLSGGMVAVYLYRRQVGEDAQILAREGAVLGLLAGIIGSVLGGVVSLFFHAVAFDSISTLIEDFADPVLQDQFSEWMALLSSPIAYLGLVFLSLVVNILFGLLGGLLGVSFWGKSPKTQIDAESVEP